MHRLEKIVKTFLGEHNKKEKPFLLALSGGSDSMVLFRICLKLNIPIIVAHINHNWRSESLLEQESLQKIAEENGVTFHLKALDPEAIQGNLEDGCRQERLLFYKEIVESFDLEGVILGHHGDDQAETVLKRIFEGASLAKLKGLSYISYFQGIKLLRPLLQVKKSEILSYAKENGITYFNDSTNDDPKFLRTRFRQKILPFISEEFGKEVAPSLIRLAQFSEELNEHCEIFLKPFRLNVLRKDGLISIDLSHQNITTTFEWKMIVKDFLNCSGLVVSHQNIETIILHLKEGKGKKTIVVGNSSLEILKKTIIIRPRECKLKI